jgi:hypothetical protein
VASLVFASASRRREALLAATFAERDAVAAELERRERERPASRRGVVRGDEEEEEEDDDDAEDRREEEEDEGRRRRAGGFGVSSHSSHSSHSSSRDDAGSAAYAAAVPRARRRVSEGTPGPSGRAPTLRESAQAAAAAAYTPSSAAALPASASLEGWTPRRLSRTLGSPRRVPVHAATRAEEANEGNARRAEARVEARVSPSSSSPRARVGRLGALAPPSVAATPTDKGSKPLPPWGGGGTARAAEEARRKSLTPATARKVPGSTTPGASFRRRLASASSAARGTPPSPEATTRGDRFRTPPAAAAAFASRLARSSSATAATAARAARSARSARSATAARAARASPSPAAAGSRFSSEEGARSSLRGRNGGVVRAAARPAARPARSVRTPPSVSAAFEARAAEMRGSLARLSNASGAADAALDDGDAVLGALRKKGFDLDELERAWAEPPASELARRMRAMAEGEATGSGGGGTP